MTVRTARAAGFRYSPKTINLDVNVLHDVFKTDARHGALTNLAASGASPIAVMSTAGHRSMATTKTYLHVAGVVFRDEAALERRMLGGDEVSTGVSPDLTCPDLRRLHLAETA